MENRIDEMKRLRFDAGWSLTDIAAKFSVSKERVRQLTGKSRGRNKSKAQMEKERKAEQQRYEFAASHPELTTQELAVAMGLSPNCMYVGKYWRGARHAVNGTDEMMKGREAEEYVSKKLSALDISHRLTNSRPVDIVLNDGRTVEVRSRWAPEATAKSENFFFFPMNRERKAGRPLADVYIFVIVTDFGEPDCFIVPANMLPQTLAFGFCWPHGRDHRLGDEGFVRFQDQWDYLKPETPDHWLGKNKNLR